MSNKIFSTYKAGKERGIRNNDRLIVEIGHRHVACLVIGGTSNSIEDLEVFDLPADSFKTFEESFAYVVIGSRLLDKHYADKRVFLNVAECVTVPAQFYSTTSATDYLNMVFGEAHSEVFKDEINTSLNVVNAYRMPVQVREVIEKNLAMVTVEHTYSNMLRSDVLLAQPGTGSRMSVRFYPSHFILSVTTEGQLQLINSFTYNSGEDVLYHLLNTCRQLNLPSTTLYVSGMVDKKFAVYDQLGKYFPNLSVDEILPADIDLQEHPAHYFTPFFKLAE